MKKLKSENGWIVIPKNFASYGTDYETRAGIAHRPRRIRPDDVVYPTAFLDGEDKPLDGANRYVLHLEKGQTPPTNATWSVSMYDPQGYYVPNAIDRYNLAMWMPLQYNADGPLDLYVQPGSPGADREANWLPSPANGPFSITVRINWPKQEVLDGTYKLPPLKRAHEPSNDPHRKGCHMKITFQGLPGRDGGLSVGVRGVPYRVRVAGRQHGRFPQGASRRRQASPPDELPPASFLRGGPDQRHQQGQRHRRLLQLDGEWRLLARAVRRARQEEDHRGDQVREAFLNPSRYWVMDEFWVYEDGVDRTFGGIKMTWMGVVPVAELEKAVTKGHYNAGYIYRNTQYKFNKGSEVYLLDAPDGEVFVMQSFTNDVQKQVDVNHIKDVGPLLHLPPGWKFRAVVLDRDLIVNQERTKNLAHVFQDDLKNAYQGSDGGKAFNFVP